MAVSNPPSMSSVIAEFGGPGNLRAYYRGGAYVPNTGANAAISTDPNSLRLSQFAGASKATYVPMTLSIDDVYGATRVGISNDLIGSSYANVANGTAPYTFSTIFVSGASFTISGTSSQTPSFHRAGNPPATFANGYYQTTVTDATGATISKQFQVVDDRGSI